MVSYPEGGLHGEEVVLGQILHVHQLLQDGPDLLCVQVRHPAHLFELFACVEAVTVTMEWEMEC